MKIKYFDCGMTLLLINYTTDLYETLGRLYLNIEYKSGDCYYVLSVANLLKVRLSCMVYMYGSVTYII